MSRDRLDSIASVVVWSVALLAMYLGWTAYSPALFGSRRRNSFTTRKDVRAHQVWERWCGLVVLLVAPAVALLFKNLLLYGHV